MGKFERNKQYKTRGGWMAEVVWCYNSGLYAIHKPGEEVESVPIWHHLDGAAHPALAVNEPPSYLGHPADLIENELSVASRDET